MKIGWNHETHEVTRKKYNQQRWPMEMRNRLWFQGVTKLATNGVSGGSLPGWVKFKSTPQWRMGG